MIIEKLTSDEESKIKAIKDRLHRHPELSWEEYETAKIIRDYLGTLDGVSLIPNPLETAVIARIAGAKPGKNIALRGDIDALKATEEWPSEVVSEVPGVAHACGHDFHTAGLLGAATILSKNRDKLQGDALLIFQPAEETTTGAGKLIETGFIDALKIDAIFGLHNRPEIEVGKVVVKSGPLMAAKKNFRIILHGVGGHGSMPHKCTDPIVCMASLIQNIQTIVSRNTDPLEALVLSIGSVHGGSCENLIVDRVELTGSMRYFSEAVGTRTMERLAKIVAATAEVYECESELVYEEQLPALVNEEPMVSIAKKAAEIAMGEEAIVTSMPTLATEDYALFMKEIPGFFYWLGVGHLNETCYSWHNTQFHTDDAALADGAALLAESVFVAQRELGL